MDEKSGSKSMKRWNRISMEAAKQCNRGIIPKVGIPLSFKEAWIMQKEVPCFDTL